MTGGQPNLLNFAFKITVRQLGEFKPKSQKSQGRIEISAQNEGVMI